MNDMPLLSVWASLFPRFGNPAERGKEGSIFHSGASRNWHFNEGLEARERGFFPYLDGVVLDPGLDGSHAQANTQGKSFYTV